MTIELLGDNCRRCQRLRDNIELALKSCKKQTSFQQIEEPQKFAEYGLLSLPGLAINGQVITAGQLLSTQEILDLLDT